MGGLRHVEWALDVPAPNHVLAVGQRYFRNGTARDAVAIIERRLIKFAESGHQIGDNVAELLLRDAQEQRGEWNPGWPMIDRWTEADAAAAKVQHGKE